MAQKNKRPFQPRPDQTTEIITVVRPNIMLKFENSAPEVVVNRIRSVNKKLSNTRLLGQTFVEQANIVSLVQAVDNTLENISKQIADVHQNLESVRQQAYQFIIKHASDDKVAEVCPSIAAASRKADGRLTEVINRQMWVESFKMIDISYLVNAILSLESYLDKTPKP